MQSLPNQKNAVFAHKQNVARHFCCFLRKKVKHFVHGTLVLTYSNTDSANLSGQSFFNNQFQPRSWGAITMNATSIPSYQATSRSLNSSIFTKKGQIRKFLFACIVVALLFCAQGEAADAGNDTETRSARSADILRQDILRLVGPVTDQQAQESTVANDSFLVRLNRHAGNFIGFSATPYGMVVRGIDPIESALLRDAQDGKWDQFDLFQAAMAVEGIRDANLIRAYENRLDAVLAKVGVSVTQETLTREVFETLHRDLLTKPYDIDCTELGKVFETGHFNCVSATVLFNILAEKAGLDVCALEMPGHALSRVKLQNTHGGVTAMNLETTCPDWFTLQGEVARTQATLQRVAPVTATVAKPIGGKIVESLNTAAVEAAVELNDVPKQLREITPVQLVATIYYNQGVDFHAEERYAEAALANVKALHLDPNSETAWGNLMAALNNWAIKIVTETKRYDLAATLLDQGVYLDPNYDKFKANQLHVYYHWIHELAREGRSDDARKVFALADQRLPGDKDLAALMTAIGN